MSRVSKMSKGKSTKILFKEPEYKAHVRKLHGRVRRLFMKEWLSAPNKLMFLSTAVSRNYILWNDGLFIDFAQKKTVDLWIRKFVIFTGFLFVDRFLMDTFSRFFNDNLVIPFYFYSQVDFDNTHSILSSVLGMVSLILVLTFLTLVML